LRGSERDGQHEEEPPVEVHRQGTLSWFRVPSPGNRGAGQILSMLPIFPFRCHDGAHWGHFLLERQTRAALPPLAALPPGDLHVPHPPPPSPVHLHPAHRPAR